MAGRRGDFDRLDYFKGTRHVRILVGTWLAINIYKPIEGLVKDAARKPGDMKMLGHEAKAQNFSSWQANPGKGDMALGVKHDPAAVAPLDDVVSITAQLATGNPGLLKEIDRESFGYGDRFKHE